MKGTLATILGTLLSVSALAAWFYVAPAAGSGWILFVAFLGTLGLLNSIREQGLATVAGAIITAAAGSAWFFHREFSDSGWVLFLCILAGLGTFKSLNSTVSEGTKQEKKPKESEDETR